MGDSTDPGLVQSCLVDLAYMVTHEFNNVLNNMLLQVALVEHSGRLAGATSDLAAIRQQGAKAAAMIRHFQQLSHSSQRPAEAVHLNEVVHAVADGLTVAQRDPEGVAESRPVYASPAPPSLKLHPDLPPVAGTVADLQRLVRLLIESAAEADPSHPATVSTFLDHDQVVLSVEDLGPQVSEKMLTELFEPFAPLRAETNGWKLTVCKAIARRLQAAIQGANRREGGMVFTVSLRQASEP